MPSSKVSYFRTRSFLYKQGKRGKDWNETKLKHGFMNFLHQTDSAIEQEVPSFNCEVLGVSTQSYLHNSDSISAPGTEQDSIIPWTKMMRIQEDAQKCFLLLLVGY